MFSMRMALVWPAVLILPASWAAAADTRVLSVEDGVPIHYQDSGKGKVALIFVHCWSCNAGFWKNQVPEFSARYRVVAIDLAGHGASGKGREAWTVQAFARDVQTVVERLKLKKVVLIGHSMGGPVILEAARLMPERVIGLVPVDTLQDVTQEFPMESRAKFLENFKKDFQGTTRGFVATLFGAAADPLLVQKVAEEMAAAHPEVAQGAMKELMDYDKKAGLAGIRAPITAINGDKWPTNLPANQKFAPQFQASILSGSGHFPQLENPAEFNRLLEAAIQGFLPKKKR